MPPYRYRPHFRDIKVGREGSSYRGGGRSIIHWQCRLCGQIIKPNTAGAQSHIAKHVRQTSK